MAKIRKSPNKTCEGIKLTRLTKEAAKANRCVAVTLVLHEILTGCAMPACDKGKIQLYVRQLFDIHKRLLVSRKTGKNS